MQASNMVEQMILLFDAYPIAVDLQADGLINGKSEIFIATESIRLNSC